MDGIDLWKSALTNTATTQNDTGPSLLEIFPDATRLLSGNPDVIGSITSIINSYLLLNGEQILTVIG